MANSFVRETSRHLGPLDMALMDIYAIVNLEQEQKCLKVKEANSKLQDRKLGCT
jgi:hypothetical protein